MTRLDHLNCTPHHQRLLQSQVAFDGNLAACIPNWPALTYLSLSSTDSGDEVFTELPALKSLRVLAASHTAVTGAGESLGPFASWSMANPPLLFYATGKAAELDDSKGCHNATIRCTCLTMYSSRAT